MRQQLYTLAMLAFLGLGTFVNAQVAEGVVGINTDTPSATLDINTKQGTTKSFKITNTSDNETMTVLNSGNVGIGTDSPTTKLDVGGTARVRELPDGNSSDKVIVADANGNLKNLPSTHFMNSDIPIYGLETTEDVTLYCNEENIGDTYELLEGYLQCGKFDNNRKWLYYGMIIFRGTRYVSQADSLFRFKMYFDPDTKVVVEGVPFLEGTADNVITDVNNGMHGLTEVFSGRGTIFYINTATARKIK